MMARVNLLNFTNTGVISLNLTAVDPSLKGFAGGFTDGRYGYLVPSNNPAPFGKIARFDLQNFTNGGVTTLDLTLVDPALKAFQGGFTDGQYGYFVPNGYPTSNGKLARVDLQNFNTGGVTILDLTLVDSTLKGFVGGFTDGRYGYLVPNYYVDTYHGKVVRIDLRNFTPGGVTVLDLGAIDPDLKGFWGGFTDGRYGYFVPWAQAVDTYSGKLARVDLSNFTPSGVTVRDFSATNPALKGFRGGFTNGAYGYFVPFQQPQEFGKVVRIQLFFGGTSP
jgi:hypothetical protein